MSMDNGNIDPRLAELAARAEELAKPYFAPIDLVAEANTAKVLAAFQKFRVSDSHFSGSTGYGYDDKGRDTLDEIYADIFKTEAALVRIGLVNGTHAIACALYGALRPGDTLLSATGAPYDTLGGVIGFADKGFGSLSDYGVAYKQAELDEKGKPDLDAISAALEDRAVRAVLIQRSGGYSARPALSLKEIGGICALIKGIDPTVNIIVDNCYGEFVEEREPTELGADIAAGSLIKNPGGGLAPAGGYLAGRRELVERAAARMTAPGIGGDCGPSLGHNRLLYQGLFMAPHTVAQALKTAAFCAALMELMGYKSSPGYAEARHDIIQRVDFGGADALLAFCEGIQAASPVDSFVRPEPWDMPGYDCPVVMAAGTFVQGSSIELSCDAPMRAPYSAYLQGALTYEAGKTGVIMAAQSLLD